MSFDAVEVIPSARRLIHSLRDMGYEFAAAVADLIDNSIEAMADTIRIDLQWKGRDSYIIIADNGIGLSASQLQEALRFGSERDYEIEDLGKFGLGLKTASLSQCLRLIVASRNNERRADIHAYCWDLSHVEATNRWEILPIKSTELDHEIRQHLKETTGTVVVWERLDRILGYNKPDGEHARKHFLTMCRELEEHLAMVFHRFLAGEVRGRRLAIYLNNNKVMPWDPFARSEAATEKLTSVSIRVEGIKGRSDVVLEPYVLPPQAKFSTPEAFNRTSGPSKWNRQQGFYIYRADRMIQSGGWSNLRTLDEHTKLARIALSFSPRLDDEFKINVPKMRVALPATIRDEVSKAIGPAVKLANLAYRNGERGHSPPTRSPSITPSSLSSTTNSGSSTGDNPGTNGQTPKEPSAESGSQYGVISPLLAKVADAAGNRTDNSVGCISSVDLEQVEKLLECVALPDELPVIQRVMARAKTSIGGKR